jgi:hypothetical protein
MKEISTIWSKASKKLERSRQGSCRQAAALSSVLSGHAHYPHLGAVLMREKRGCRKPGIGQEGLFPEECNSCSRYSDGA